MTFVTVLFSNRARYIAEELSRNLITIFECFQNENIIDTFKRNKEMSKSFVFILLLIHELLCDFSLKIRIRCLRLNSMKTPALWDKHEHNTTKKTIHPSTVLRTGITQQSLQSLILIRSCSEVQWVNMTQQWLCEPHNNNTGTGQSISDGKVTYSISDVLNRKIYCVVTWQFRDIKLWSTVNPVLLEKAIFQCVPSVLGQCSSPTRSCMVYFYKASKICIFSLIFKHQLSFWSYLLFWK